MLDAVGTVGAVDGVGMAGVVGTVVLPWNPSPHKAETGGSGKLKIILYYTMSSEPVWAL